MTTTLAVYKGALDKVKIIYDGEIFEQVAVSHLNYAPENN
jgi:ABC-type dipeptide/oligopeptide/nickel transport system ATPase component